MRKIIYLLFGILSVGACTNTLVEGEDDDILIINVSPDDKKDVTADVDIDINPVDMGEDLALDLGTPLQDIAIELAKLPNVDNVEELRPSQGKRRFYIDFRLPLDHFASSSPAFTQRGILYFRDYSAPTVLMTTGYGLPDVRSLENLPVGVTQILDANQLVLGHRFFTGALPAFENQNWSFVNIQQSAEDTHDILQSMRSVLQESWIGTGWSKGGMTILFQEYFHPDDLDLAVPMVAPISFGLSDERYPPFLATIGTQECRDKLDESMLGALDRRLELADVFNPANDNERQQYAFQIKYSVISFQWSYWQYYGLSSCQFIPPGNASARDLVSFFVYNQLPKVGPSNPEPRPINAEEAPLIAYTYQGLGQLGFQDVYAAGHLQRMVELGYVSANEKLQIENQSYEFGDFPWSTNPTFDPQPMIDVDAWLRADARDIVAIYGEYDPWTGGKITLNPANDSQVYIAPGGSHGTFLSDLEGPDYNAVRERVLSFDNRDRVRSATPLAIPKATQIQRETLRKLLRQEL